MSRLENLLGAFVTSSADDLEDALAAVTNRGTSASAALVYLSRVPGTSIEGLRAPLGLSHSATVRLIARLADDGLVARRPGSDGRTTSLVLTASGRKRAERVHRSRTDAMRHRLRHLRPRERRQLELLLERLLAGTAVDRPPLEICRLCDVTVCTARRCPVTKQQFASAAAVSTG